MNRQTVRRKRSKLRKDVFSARIVASIFAFVLLGCSQESFQSVKSSSSKQQGSQAIGPTGADSGTASGSILTTGNGSSGSGSLTATGGGSGGTGNIATGGGGASGSVTSTGAATSGGSTGSGSVTSTSSPPTCSLILASTNARSVTWAQQKQVSGPFALAGTSITLQLTSTGATSATVNNGVGSVGVNGQISVPSAMPIDSPVLQYTATVSGVGGTSSCSTSLSLGILLTIQCDQLVPDPTPTPVHCYPALVRSASTPSPQTYQRQIAMPWMTYDSLNQGQLDPNVGQIALVNRDYDPASGVMLFPAGKSSTIITVMAHQKVPGVVAYYVGPTSCTYNGITAICGYP